MCICLVPSPEGAALATCSEPASVSVNEKIYICEREEGGQTRTIINTAGDISALPAPVAAAVLLTGWPAIGTSRNASSGSLFSAAVLDLWGGGDRGGG